MAGEPYPSIIDYEIFEVYDDQSKNEERQREMEVIEKLRKMRVVDPTNYFKAIEENDSYK